MAPGPTKTRKKHVPLFVIALGKVVSGQNIYSYVYIYIYSYLYIYHISIYHVSVKLDQGKIKHLKAPPRIRSGWFKRSEDIVFDDLFFS